MAINIKKIIIASSLCLLISISSAGTLESLLSKHKQSKTVLSILAVDADSENIIYRRQSDAPMIPASNMKLVTTAAALHLLGNDYAFQTKIGLLGRDLVVVGGGDPLLAEPKNDSVSCQAANALMDMIIHVLQEASVSSVDNIILDTSYFDENRVHPSWPPEQLNQWYACEVGGLNFYNNCIHLEVNRSGNSAVISMTPPNGYVTLINQLKLISSGSSAVGAYRNSVPNKLFIKGKLNQAAGFDVAIENPAGLFGSILKNRLISSGISVEGSVTEQSNTTDSGPQYLLIVKTPIADVIRRSNKDSLGLAAECLVKTISAEQNPVKSNGRWQHGLEMMSQYLNSLDVPESQYTLDDGSGLSRINRLSAQSLVAVIKDMYKSENSDIFLNSLAVGGVDGTIRKYFHKEPYKGNIIGKTGYIKGVRTFSGVCKTPRGDIIFSILTEKGNGYTRRCINEITQAIFDGTL